MGFKLNVSNITFDNYDNKIYYTLFKFNGFLALTVGSFGIYMTLFWTPKFFGPYKYFLLNIAVWAFLFDTYSTLFYIAKFFFPAIVHCSTGILKSSDPIVAEISFNMLFLMYGGTEIAILSAFIYRYAALHRRMNAILNWRFLTFLGLFHLFHKSPSWIFYHFAVSNGTAIRESILQVNFLIHYCRKVKFSALSEHKTLLFNRLHLYCF